MTFHDLCAYRSAVFELDYISCAFGHKVQEAWTHCLTCRYHEKMGGEKIPNEKRKQESADRFYAAIEAEGYKTRSDTPYINNKTKVYLLCPLKQHEWDMYPQDWSKGVRCRFCSNRDASFALANFVASLASEGYTQAPTFAYKNNKTAVDLICPRLHEWSVIPNSWTTGYRCWDCKYIEMNLKFISKFRDHYERRGFKIVELTYSDKPAILKCQEGHSWNVVHPGVAMFEWRGCPKCYTMYNQLYLITKDVEDLQWAKVGIASTPYRLREHIKQGWTVHRTWDTLGNELVISTEKSIKKHKATQGWASLPADLMPQTGHTETFPGEHLSEVEELITSCVASSG